MLATRTMQYMSKSLLQATYLPSATHAYMGYEVPTSMP